MNSPNNTSPLIATGTLTASVNGIDNFNAESLLLVTDGRTITIGGIQRTRSHFHPAGGPGA
ncbi:hypothetical protein [Pseudomonas glycinae]|uniref:hypothetical protein n=1 Tax=Pseudomonas glycinae TaxID=1785145 RepID=UPI001F4365A3|nr:hypothetical protein [Pseudomonas glycinae]